MCFHKCTLHKEDRRKIKATRLLVLGFVAPVCVLVDILLQSEIITFMKRFNEPCVVKAPHGATKRQK